MFFTPPRLDEKKNLVSMTIFESYLSKFILDHPGLYQNVFLKLLDKIQLAAAGQERIQFNVFSLLTQTYPEHCSFECLHERFNLPAADYLLKLTADYLFPTENTLGASAEDSRDSRRSPENIFRNSLLFDEDNVSASLFL